MFVFIPTQGESVIRQEQINSDTDNNDDQMSVSDDDYSKTQNHTNPSELQQKRTKNRGVYGENISMNYGGSGSEDSYEAFNQDSEHKSGPEEIYQKNSSSSTIKSKKAKLCSNCRKPNHTVATCPEPCSRCGSKEHKINKCPQPKPRKTKAKKITHESSQSRPVYPGKVPFNIFLLVINRIESLPF